MECARGCTVGKDYRIGLMAGLVLAVVALVWVATRPSLSPEARVRRSSASGPEPSVSAQAPSPARTESVEPEIQPEQASDAPAPRGDAEPTARSDDSLSPQKIDGINRFFPTQQQAAEPNTPDLTVYEQEEKIKTTRFHIVLKNETLSGIAQRYYGSANQWPRILEANEDTITDANKIKPGTKLIIPD